MVLDKDTAVTSDITEMVSLSFGILTRLVHKENIPKNEWDVFLTRYRSKDSVMEELETITATDII